VSKKSSHNISLLIQTLYDEDGSFTKEDTMYPFELLLVAHFVGDYLAQTEYEAMNKALGRFFNRALWSHCLKYTLSFVPVFWISSLHPAWLVLIFTSHLFLDRRWPIIWWRKHINHNSDDSIRATFWLTVMTDQIFHGLILALISVVSA